MSTEKKYTPSNLVNYFGFAFLGVMLLILTIFNIIELTKNRYFFQTFNIPEVLSPIFDTLGPIPVIIIMLIISLALVITSIINIKKYFEYQKQSNQ